jgi:hypothetical protein
MANPTPRKSAWIFPSLLFLLFFLPSIFGFSGLSAQDSTKMKKQTAKEQALKAMIDSKHFDFVAQSATALNGKTRLLDGRYDLKVISDTLMRAYFPYYGRAYSTPYSADQGGGLIDFRSVQFDYQVQEDQKDGWDISIIPRDVADHVTIQLSIGKSGYGTLIMRATNRDQVSYYGQMIKAN